MFRPTITTVDLWPGVTENVGSVNHCKLIDFIEAIQGPDDEELLVLIFGGHDRVGHTEKEVGDILGISQQAVSYRFQQLLGRARNPFVRAGRQGRRAYVSPVVPEARRHGRGGGKASAAA